MTCPISFVAETHHELVTACCVLCAMFVCESVVLLIYLYEESTALPSEDYLHEGFDEHTNSILLVCCC